MTSSKPTILQPWTTEQPLAKTNIFHLHGLFLNIQCRLFLLMCVCDSPGAYSRTSQEFKLKTGFSLFLSNAPHMPPAIQAKQHTEKTVLSHQPHHKSQFAMHSASQYNNSRHSWTSDFMVLSDTYFILTLVTLHMSIDCHQDIPQGKKRY